MEYKTDIQKLFLEIMLSEPEHYVRVQNIYNIENFNSDIKPVAEFIKTHSDKYSTLPNLVQVKTVTGISVDELAKDIEIEWFLDEFEKFTRQKELNRAIMESVEYLESGDFDPVETIIKKAVQISLTRDMGLDYFEDPRARLEAIRSNNGQISTGWKNLDDKLYGGMNRGELNIFAGGSGSGKSLFMQNLSVNWILQGLNGLFITLELNQELCSMRIDSMMTDIHSKEIFKSIDDVELKVKMLQKKCGSFQVKYLPAQSSINDVRSYVREYQIQTGIKIDFMCIDYLDLLMPATAKVNPGDLFIKDKYVSEEIRNLSKELNVVTVTASQLNRSAVEETDFDHSHISGGISKINTADNVFGILTNMSMRERGRYQLQLMKTRSSAGVGQKIDLEFNVDTLRILDALTAYDPTSGGSNASSIMNSIKPKSTITTAPTTVNTPDVKSVNLKALMNKIKA